MISKKERLISAFIYLFELGYLFGRNVNPKSYFLKFHTEEASKLILKLVLPALILIILALFFQKATKILFIVAIILLIIYFVLSIIAAFNAWKGNTKKML